MKQFILFGILTLFVAGCNDDPDPSTGQSVAEQILADSTEEPEEAIPEGGLPFELLHAKPTDREGWLYYVCEEQVEVPVGGITIFKTGDAFQVHVVTIEQDAKPLELVESSATDETLAFVIHGEKTGYSFRGTLKDGVFWGNTILGNGQCAPSRLVRPAENLESPPEPSPLEGHAAFLKVLQANAKWDDLEKFIEEHPESPYVINAFYGMIAQCGPREMTDKDLADFIDLIDRSVELWGERMQQFLRMNTVLQLAKYCAHPEFASETMAQIEAQADDEIWAGVLERMKEGIQKRFDLTLRIEQIPNLEADAQTEILKQLPDELKVYRFDPFLLAKLGDALVEAGQDELAAQYYSDVVAIPGLESQYLAAILDYREELGSISDRLESVWKRLHNDDLSGLDEFNLKTYERFIENFEVDLSKVPLDSDSPNLLIELFTGSSCPPCIAADMACSILGNKLPPDRVTILQYHLNVPGPDPMTNVDTEARFFSYSGEGTPSAFLNGRAMSFVGGSASAVPDNVKSLLTEIRKEMELKAELQIELTGARPAENQIACTANVVTESLSSRWKLVVLLVEDKIYFRGVNGIPVHEMVVRKILTPSQGVGPLDGKLSWEGSVNLDKLRKDLKDALEYDEQKFNHQFPAKPLDLERLHLVAFVQDRQSRRIRQVQSIPVPSATDSSDSSEN